MNDQSSQSVIQSITQNQYIFLDTTGNLLPHLHLLVLKCSAGTNKIILNILRQFLLCSGSKGL